MHALPILAVRELKVKKKLRKRQKPRPLLKERDENWTMQYTNKKVHQNMIMEIITKRLKTIN